MNSRSVGWLMFFFALAATFSAFASPGATVIIHGRSTLYPGEKGTYSIETSRFDGQRIAVDVAASDGALSAVTLHVTSSGKDEYSFSYTMPVSAAISSKHTLAASSTVFVVTAVAPPAPTSSSTLSVGSMSINVTWLGFSPEFRVIRKTGPSPVFTNANDPDATLVYEGPNTSAAATGLSPSTTYTFAVYGKVEGASTYSTGYQTIHARTIAAGSTGTIWYVNVGTGSDSNSGTSGSPFKTIKKAMMVAISGDVISVAPGTYNTSSGETFPITLTSGVQLLGARASTTTIDAAGANQRVINCSGNSSDSKISGFTITGGLVVGDVGTFSSAQGGGIYCVNGDQTTITQSIIKGNVARGYQGNNSGTPTGGNAYGGGIYVETSFTTISNNVISGNTAVGGRGVDLVVVNGTGGSGGTGTGGGIYLTTGGATVVNNTLVANMATGGDGGFDTLGTGGMGGNGYDGAGNAGIGNLLTNNIFASNSASGGAGGFGSVQSGSSGSGFVGGYDGYSTNKSLFFSNFPSGGNTGSTPVFGDPNFVDSGNGDYHICCVSAALAAGTSSGASTIDFDGYPRPSPPSIGAFENAAATLSAPAGLNATAGSSTSVSLTWSVVSAATSYEIFVATSLSGGFTSAATTTNPAYTFTGLSSNTTYLYKVRALAGMMSDFSTIDPATTVIFTDDPLTAQSTLVKAAHFTQLRTAVNAMRSAANLSAYSFTDSSLSGATIKKVHITDLRTALNEALTALGLATLSFTDPTITVQSTQIKAVHVTELRNGVK